MSEIDWASLRKTADDATKPVPADWYEVVVDKAERKEASTGSQMIVTQLKVDTGPHAGRTLFTNFVFTPDKAFALSIFFRNMEALGIDGSFFQQLTASGMGVESSLESIAQAIVGRRARVQVGMRTWQGQERNEITGMSPATTGPGGTPGGQGPVGAPPVPGLGGPPVPASAPPTPAAAPPVPTPVAAPSAPPALPY